MVNLQLQNYKFVFLVLHYYQQRENHNLLKMHERRQKCVDINKIYLNRFTNHVGIQAIVKTKFFTLNNLSLVLEARSYVATLFYLFIINLVMKIELPQMYLFERIEVQSSNQIQVYFDEHT